jgi:hypothetical protein
LSRWREARLASKLVTRASAASSFRVRSERFRCISVRALALSDMPTSICCSRAANSLLSSEIPRTARQSMPQQVLASCLARGALNCLYIHCDEPNGPSAQTALLRRPERSLMASTSISQEPAWPFPEADPPATLTLPFSWKRPFSQAHPLPQKPVGPYLP